MFGWLMRHLRPRPAKAPVPAARQLFVDDYTVEGLEVLPDSTTNWCREQMSAAAAFAAQHVAANGTGWTDVYVRPDPPMNIAELGIPFAAAAAALGRRLPVFDEIITGSHDAPQRIERAVAFGPSPLTAIILYRPLAVPADAATLQLIELSLRGSDAEVAQVLEAMADLPSPEPLIVVDWFGAAILRIGADADIEGFRRGGRAR